MFDTNNHRQHDAFPASPVRMGAVALYGGMIIGAISLFVLIDRFGATLSAPETNAAVAAPGRVSLVPQADPVVHVLVSGLDQWLVCGLIIIVATIGKFGGALVSARLTGLGWRDSTALGLLMNTRGLMELIALNIGLDMKVISPTFFAMMVLMALVTTMAAAPLLQLLPPATEVETEE
ncbi:MAG: cation:proton antiporter [Deltaproteobacteria bacterium]